MGEDIGPTRSTAGLLRRIVRRVIGVGLALGFAAGLTWWGLMMYTSSQLRSEIERIKAANEPLTLSDIKDGDGHAGAGRYYAAAAELVSNTGVGDLLYTAREAHRNNDSLSEEQRDKLRDRLEANRHALELLKAGSSIDACRFDFRLRRGSSHFEHFSDFPLLAKLQSLQTHSFLEKGKPEQAASSVIASLRLVRIFDDQAIITLRLAALSILQRAANDTAALLGSADVSKRSARRLATMLRGHERPDEICKVLKHERAFQIYLWGPHESVPTRKEIRRGPVPSSRRSSRFFSNPFRNQLLTGKLRYYRRSLAACEKPWPDRVSALRSVEPDTGKRQGGFRWLGALAIRTVLPQLAEDEGATLAELRAARTAIFVDRYRQTHGEYPNALATAIPEAWDGVPIDPFSGEPLLYRSFSDGFVVYSVGSNQKDDGGALTRRRGDVGVRFGPGPADAEDDPSDVEGRDE